ncbi:hypothetical protein [Flavobacterium akiainvivens]|uniref:hypothetical protein n=1 Tax=Flavobacterium akiainvivens TaxID=1202724 RepID=UPI0008EA597F|nr:hypothetical protein [Flavobacterium akiainvivens]SFQ15646.1 hypothetical protein SAMN05444144_101340 [Flavobacterium akiainvivens]
MKIIIRLFALVLFSYYALNDKNTWLVVVSYIMIVLNAVVLVLDIKKQIAKNKEKQP